MLRVLPPTFEPVLQQIRLQGLFSRSTAIQFVLQQFCKTSCTFFVARYTRGPLAINKLPSDALRAHGSHYSGVFDRESWKPNCSDRQLAADLHRILHRCLYAICSTIPGYEITAPRFYSHHCHLCEIATHSHILLRIWCTLSPFAFSLNRSS